MASIGEKLRQERLRRNLDLAEVASRTSIRQNFLEAIEAEAWDRLPGTFFAKSFVRQYASALGMDASEVDAEVEKLFKVEEPASDAESSPRRLRIHLQPLDTLRQRVLRKRRRLKHLGLFVGVGLACYGAYALWQGGRRALSVPGERQITSSPPQRARGVAQLPPENPRTPSLTDKLVVNLIATERTWVSVRVDGREVFAGTLNPGDRRSFEGTGLVKLITGNAAGLEVQWNGKPVGPIGQQGTVRFVEFTREGFQIQKMGM